MMKKKQTITKDEARILLQLHPLSANLWQLAGDSLPENAIRFPDASYLDSLSWPDYLPKKRKNGETEKHKIGDAEKHSIGEKGEIHDSKSVIIDQPTMDEAKPIVEIFDKVDVKNNLIEVTEEIISIEIIETEFPVTKKKTSSKRKLKKETEEIITDFSDEDKEKNKFVESKKAVGHSSKSLDFYEWLEELKEISGPLPIKQKSEKAKSKLTKEAKEIADAKTLAENSLKLGDEIVSETLARLLARQGHREEAIEMYQKLILKYPEKGATFAAALQKLKS